MFLINHIFLFFLILTYSSSTYGMSRALRVLPRATRAPMTSIPVALKRQPSLSHAFAKLSLQPSRACSSHQPTTHPVAKPLPAKQDIKEVKIIAPVIDPHHKFKHKMLVMLESGFLTLDYLVNAFPKGQKQVETSIALLPYYMGKDQKFADNLYGKALARIKNYHGSKDAIHPLLFTMLILFSPRCKELVQAAADNIDNMPGQQFDIVFQLAYASYNDLGHELMQEKKLTTYTDKEIFKRIVQECEEIIEKAETNR